MVKAPPCGMLDAMQGLDDTREKRGYGLQVGLLLASSGDCGGPGGSPFWA
jgi:hypothetical protein